jgi:bisphosphoglycerate-independent phosphoglycerate mutase
MEKLKHRPVALIVLDGWGERTDKKDNAIAAAKKPFFDSLLKKYPHSLLEASGRAVGLPQDQMGNSEVGHTTIGAGKVVATDLVRISDSVTDGTFSKNPAFIDLFTHVKNNNSALHVCGLVSPGGVHSHIEHLQAFLSSAKDFGLTKIFIHVFTDGRDTPPQSAFEYIVSLEKFIDELGVGRIVSVSGRYYAMDRDNNWDRLARTEEVWTDPEFVFIRQKKNAHTDVTVGKNVWRERIALPNAKVTFITTTVISAPEQKIANMKKKIVNMVAQATQEKDALTSRLLENAMTTAKADFLIPMENITPCWENVNTKKKPVFVTMKEKNVLIWNVPTVVPAK